MFLIRLYTAGLLCMTTPIPKGPATPERLIASSCSSLWSSGLRPYSWPKSEDLVDGGASPYPDWLVAGDERQVCLYGIV